MNEIDSILFIYLMFVAICFIVAVIGFIAYLKSITEIKGIIDKGTITMSKTKND